MSLNNKFGKCCKCPARVNLGREFTEYRSASIFSHDDMVKSEQNNTNDYNDYLENNGVEIIKQRTKELEAEHICKTDGKNIFFIDSSDFHQRFKEMNDSIEIQEVVPRDKYLSNNLSVRDRSNYTLREITGDQALVTSSKA